MNKNLDHLFEQARESMQSEMPLEEVQQLIHGQASPSLWTNQKIWIMSTSIIGILTIGIVCWLNNYNHPTTTAVTTIPDSPFTALQQNKSPEQNTIVLQDAIPDNIPLPILKKEDLTPNPVTLASLNPTIPEVASTTKKATKLDSLGPKKTFTEYKLEIKKENSEQEIKKLKAELSNYGIHMEVKVLNYDNNNKIKRFKGQFKTDSLFCGSTMNDYEFDISGAFKSMEFIFRVADDKNLKYLKIQSENFEETIECYDDEVISSTQEARKLNRQMQEDMVRAQEEMTRAQQKIANAQQKIARAQEKIAELKKEEYTKHDVKRLEHLEIVNWDQIDTDIEKAMQDIEVELEDANVVLQKVLQNKEVIILDNNFKKDIKVLHKDLSKMRIDIEREIRDQLKEHRIQRNKDGETTMDNTPSAPPLPQLNSKEQTAQQLNTEAAAMLKASKKLQKEAKERRKMARKMARKK